jgi:autotransporter translocation and assembly factor TamB
MNEISSTALSPKKAKNSVAKISVLMVFATIILLAVILLTPAGLRIALAIAKDKIPGDLTYSAVSGRIIGPIDFTDLKYSDTNIIYTARKIKFNLDKSALLRLNVNVNQLEIDDSKLTTLNVISFFENNKPATEKKTAEKIVKKWLPFWLERKLEIKDIKVNKFDLYNRNNEQTWGLEKLQGSAHITPKRIDSNIDLHAYFPRVLNLSWKTTGKPANYQLQIIATGKHTHFKVSGTGSLTQLKLHTIESKLWGGKLTGDTNIRWLPDLQWNLKWNTLNIDPARVWANNKTFIRLPTRISGMIRGQGDNKTTKIQWSKLKVNLYNHSLKSYGLLHLIDNKIHNINIKAFSKAGNINVNGLYKDHWQLKWHINIKNLLIISPFLKGSINAIGSLQGKRNMPRSIGKITALNFLWNNIGYKSLYANWDVLPDATAPASINLKASGAKHASQAIQNLSLQLYGTTAQHSINITGRTPNSNFDTQISGADTDNGWQGVMQNLTLHDKITKDNWQLKNPVKMQHNKDGFALSELDLENKTSFLHVSGKIKNTENAKLKIELSSWPLHNIQPWLPKILKMQGRMTGKSDIAIDEGTIKKFDNHLSLGKGTWKITPYKNLSSLSLHVDTASISSHLHGSTMHFKLNGGLKNKSNWQLKLALSNFNKLAVIAPTQPITGNIQLDHIKVHSLQTIIPGSDRLRGVANAAFNIKGTYGNPIINGDVKFEHGAVSLTYYGIRLENAHASIHASGQQAKFSLQANSDGKPLFFKGDARFDAKNFIARAKLTGDNVLIWNDDKFTFYATPDLDFYFKNMHLKINGTLKLPGGSIHPEKFASEQYLSEDTIILKKQTGPKNKNPYNFTSNINLVAGQGLKIDASGVTGHITGSVRVKSATNAVTVANGRLSLDQGTYLTHGRSLNLERGQLIFRRSPLDNPFLNIRAARIINSNSSDMSSRLRGKLSVGLTMTGTLRKPKINFFASDSSLTQSEIISYLAFGQQTVSTLTLATNALSSLSSSDNSKPGLAQEIQQGLALNELGMEQSQQNDPLHLPLAQQESFVIGKKIGKSFNIRYLSSTGQLNSSDQLQLRYDISQRWSIQTELSVDSTNNRRRDYGADLFYTIEKN